MDLSLEIPPQKKKIEKKKYQRKVASTKLRSNVYETGTDTDDQSEVLRNRSFRKPDPSGELNEPAKPVSKPPTPRKSRLSRGKVTSTPIQPKISSYFEKSPKQPTPEKPADKSAEKSDKPPVATPKTTENVASTDDENLPQVTFEIIKVTKSADAAKPVITGKEKKSVEPGNALLKFRRSGRHSEIER